MHSVDVCEIALNKKNSDSGRQLVIIDKNRDLYITKASKVMLCKLGHMVETIRWNDENDQLAGIVDTKFVIWYYPAAVFVDDDIALLSKFESDASPFGTNARIEVFRGTNCTVTRSDGTAMAASNVSLFPGLLQDFVKKKEWERAIRLCRRVKNRELWAALASMSLAAQEFNTAEVAYAAVDEVYSI